MINNLERSGFSGSGPEGKIPKPTSKDIDDIIAGAEAYTPRGKSGAPEQRDSEENLDPGLPHNGYLIDRAGHRLRISDSTMGPWEGGGYYRVYHPDGVFDSLSFKDLHDGLASGEYRIEPPNSPKK